MASFYNNIRGVCTAMHLDGLASLDNYSTNNLLIWLESTIPLGLERISGLKSYQHWFNGYALLFAISTRTQRCEKTMEKLGFTKAFVAPKDNDDSRETDSGALTLWCTQPWVFEEARLKFIQELKEGDKPTAEEITRRKSFDEFMISHYQNSEVMKPILESENKKKLYRKDPVPLGVGIRNRVFEIITTLTGGYEPGKDPVLIPLIRNKTLTWGHIKDQAIQWRNGEFK